MSEEPVFQNAKLKSESEIEEKLSKEATPAEIYRVAIDLLGEMESTFGQAILENECFRGGFSAVLFQQKQLPYEGNVMVNEQEAYTEFEKTAVELGGEMGKLFFDATVSFCVCKIAEERCDKGPIDTKELVDKLTNLLIAAQEKEKCRIEEVIAKGGTPAEKYKEFRKKLVDDKMAEMEKAYGIEDVFIWNNFSGDLDQLYKNLQIFEQSLQGLSEPAKACLKEDKPRIVLGTSSGKALTTNNELVVSLKWDEPNNYSKALEESLTDYHLFSEAQRKIQRIKSREGLDGGFTWRNQLYEGEKLNKAMDAFDDALAALTPAEKGLLKKYKPPIAIGMNTGIQLNSVNQKLIELDYRDPGGFAEILKTGIHQYRCFVEVSNELSGLASEYGVKGLSMWNNVVYDYEDVQKSLVAVRRAFEQLKEEELEAFQKANVEVILSRSSDAAGVENAKEGDLVVAIYYKLDYKDMVVAFRSSLKKLKKTAIVAGRNLKPKLDEFLKDPLLEGLDDFELPLEVRGLYIGNLEEFEIAVIRTLNIYNLEHTDENILKIAERLIEEEKRFSRVELFQNRNVFMALNGEKFRDSEKDQNGKEYKESDYKYYETVTGGEYRFGVKGVVDILEKGASSFDLERVVGRTIAELMASKGRILDAIRFTPPPFTFVFNGHGSDEALTLFNYEKLKKIFGEQQAYEISEQAYAELKVDEVAQAISDRYINFPELIGASPDDRDIYMFVCCDGSHFFRNVYDKLRSGESTRVELTTLADKIGQSIEGKFELPNSMPIMISASEYGQYGFSSYRDEFGNAFFSKVLNFDNAKWDDGAEFTIGTIIENQEKGDSNPTVFIPDQIASVKENGYLQLAQKDIDEKEKAG